MINRKLTKKINIGNVMGDINTLSDKELNQYNTAYNLYLDAKFHDAKEMFHNLYQRYDKFLYQLYKERCERLLQKNIQNFNGVFEYKTK